MDRAWRGVALGTFVHLVVVGAYLTAFTFNPTWFVHFGRESRTLPVAQRVLGDDVLVPHIDGHDGQAFWLLARDPLLLRADGLESHLDRPAYRSQRILYPALAALWRLAGERALVWGLLATNLAVVGIGGCITAGLVRQLGVPQRAALAFALNPAVLFAVLLDVSDALMIALLVWTLLCLLRERWVSAAIAAAAAGLAKEQALLGIVSLLIVWPRGPWPRVPLRVRAAVGAAALLTVGTWALYQRWRLGWPPSQIQEFTFPVWGYIDSYLRGWRHFGNWADGATALALWPLAWVTLRRWRRSPSPALALSLPYALYVPFLSAQVVNLALNAVRAVGPLITFLAIDAYRQSRRAVTSSPGPATAS